MSNPVSGRTASLAKAGFQFLLLVVIAAAILALLWPRAAPTIEVGTEQTATASQVTYEPDAGSTASAWSDETLVPSSSASNASAAPKPSAAVEATPLPVPTGYTVAIASGLQPHWSADAAATSALDRIRITERNVGRALTEPRIVSVEAMVGTDVPRGISGPYDDLTIAWVVHAYGTFVNAHGPQEYVFSEGWYIFDDQGSGVGSTFKDAHRM